MPDQDNDLQKQLNSFLTTRRTSPSPSPNLEMSQSPASTPKQPDLKNEVSSFLTKQRAPKMAPTPTPQMGPGQRVSIAKPLPAGLPSGVQDYVRKNPGTMSDEQLDNISKTSTDKSDPYWGAQSWWLRAANKIAVAPFDKINSFIDKMDTEGAKQREQNRLEAYQYFDQKKGQQVSLDEEARRHPLARSQQIANAVTDKAMNSLQHVVLDPRNLTLMLAGEPAGAAGLKGAGGLFRIGADAGFTAMQGYGAYEGAKGAWQKFKSGDYVGGATDLVGTGIDSAFTAMGTLGAIGKIRAIGTLNTLDTVAQKAYGREWADLPRAQRDVVSEKVLKANQSRAPFIEELKKAEDSRDVGAIKKAYARMTGAKFTKTDLPSGVKMSDLPPEERVSSDIKKLQDRYLEQQFGIAEQPRDRVTTDWEKNKDAGQETTIRAKMEAGQELSASERSYVDQRRKDMATLQGIPVTETAKLSDESFRRWADVRTKESYGANEKDIQAYSELAEGLINRGWLDEAKAVLTRANYVMGESSDVAALGYGEVDAQRLAEQNKGLNQKLFDVQQDARKQIEQIEPAWHQMIAQEVEAQRQIEEEASGQSEQDQSDARAEMDRHEIDSRQELDGAKYPIVAQQPAPLAAPQRVPAPMEARPLERGPLQAIPKPLALPEGREEFPKPPESTAPPPVLPGAPQAQNVPILEGRKPATDATGRPLNPYEESLTLENLVAEAEKTRQRAQEMEEALSKRIDDAIAGDEERRGGEQAALGKRLDDAMAGDKERLRQQTYPDWYKGRGKLEEPPYLLSTSPEEARRARDARYMISALDQAARALQEQRDDAQEASSSIPSDQGTPTPLQAVTEKADKTIQDLAKQRDSLLQSLPAGDRPDMERDRPAVEIPGKRLGNETEIKTARGSTVSVQYAVVDARQVEPSHDSELQPNPNYPARRQPRNRNRAFSKDQFLKIAANFDPAMLGENFSGNNGAPVVGDDLFVDGGNMRSIVLKHLYQIGDPAAREYKDWLATSASKFGVDSDTVTKMKQPILVRIRRTPLESIGMTPEAFSRELNEPFEASMSTVETARADAESVSPDMLSMLHPSEDGNLFTAANQNFIQQFFQSVIAPADRGKYMMADGRINQDGVRRIQAAVFAKAFPGAEALLEKLSEDPDNNIRNATKAMLAAAPKFTQLNQLVEDGTLHDLRLSNDLAEAARKLASLREQGMSVTDYLNQQRMFGEDISPAALDLLAVLGKNARRPANVADILNAYAEDAMRAGRKDQGNMFGGAGEAPDKSGLLKGAINKVTGPSLLADQSQGSLEMPPPLANKQEAGSLAMTPIPETSKSTEGAAPPPNLERPERSEADIKNDIKDIRKSLRDKKLDETKKAQLQQQLQGYQGELDAQHKLAPPPEDKNTIFTKDAADAARKRMQERRGRMQAGVDPEDLKDIATIMGYHVERGLRKFADVASRVVDELGDWVQPHLADAWNRMVDVAWDRMVEAIRNGADDKKVREKVGIFREVTSERSEANAPGGVSDAPPPLQEPKSDGKVDEREAGPAGAGESTGLPGRRGGPGAARGRRTGAAELSNVQPAELKPQAERTTPPAWKMDAWKQTLSSARLPENAQVPTQRIYQHIAEKLTFPGQDAIADYALSELLDGSGGIVLGLPTGTGKSYLSSAIIRQLQESNPDKFKNILYLTASRKLVDDWTGIAKGFGVDADTDHYYDPRAAATPPKPGVYATTMDTARNREGIEKYPWDLVVVDEAGQARRSESSKRGALVATMGSNAKKVLYLSATPFSNAAELQYLTKLSLWDEGGFDKWVRQFGISRSEDGTWQGHTNPRKLEKLRQQLIERGQFISQEKNFEGFNSHFAVVPLNKEQVNDVRNIDRAFSIARDYYQRRGNNRMMMVVAANKINYLKHYIESTRIPATIDLAQRAMKAGYQVPIFSETHREVDTLYKPLIEPDKSTNGYITQILPKIKGFIPALQAAFGDDFADYSGGYSRAREKQLEGFLGGQKKVFYTTYAAGGLGLSLHDTGGEAPRFSIYHGLPWSGYSFEQGAGRTWRYGTKSDTNAAFLLSNVAPEVQLVVGRIVPRLEALNAVVNGVDFKSPMIEGLSNAEEALSYEHGEAAGTSAKDLTNFVDTSKVFKSHKQIDMPDAKSMIGPGKGMKVRARMTPPPGETPKVPPARGTFTAGIDPIDAAKRVSKELKETFQRGTKLPSDPLLDGVLDEFLNRKAIKENLESAMPTAEDKQKFVNGVSTLAFDKVANTDGNPAPVVHAVLRDSMEWAKQHGGSAHEFVNEGVEGNKAMWQFMMRSGRDIIRSVAKKAGMPELGEEINGDILEYNTQRAITAGHWMGQVMDWVKTHKITPENLEEVWDMKEGKKAVPPGSWQEKAVGDLEKLFYDVQDHAVAAGVKLMRYNEATGKPDPIPFPSGRRPDYMPRIYDEEVFKHGSKKREQMINSIMQRRGITRLQAESYLESRRVPDVPLAGNLERTREHDIEGYEQTLPAIYKYLNGAAEAIARTKVFGQGREILDGKIVQLPESGGRDTIRQVFDGMLKKQPFHEGPRKFMKFASDWVALTKMTFTAIPMMSHTIKAAMVPGVREFARGFAKVGMDYPAAFRDAIESGAVAPEKTLDAINAEYGTHTGNVGDWILSKTGVKGLDHFSRVLANTVAQGYLERRVLPKLMEDPQHDYRRITRDLLSVPDKMIDEAIKNGKWSDEALKRAGTRWAAETQGTTDPSELPPYWRGRSNQESMQYLAALARTTVMLKAYIYRNGKFFSNLLFKEAMRGNIRPWIPFLTLAPAAGELLNDLREISYGRTDRIKELAHGETYHPLTLLGRMSENAGFIVAASLASNMIETFNRLKGGDPRDVVQRFVLGPFFGDVAETAGRAYTAGKDATEGNLDKTLQQVEDWARSIAPATRLALPPALPGRPSGGGRGEYGMTPTPSF